MYKLPAFTNEQIEKLAKEHKLFETVYGCKPAKDSIRLMENLKEVNRGWYCVRCGLCCCSDLIVPVITVVGIPVSCFPALIKDAKRNPSQCYLYEHTVGINQTKHLCPNLRGTTPLNMRCAIHQINKGLKTPCYTHRPFENWNIPCLFGAQVIQKLDEDFDEAMQRFNKTRYYHPITNEKKTCPI